MSLLPALCCVNCLHVYDDNRKICVGLCNDSICVSCRNGLSRPDCPICGKQDAFLEEKINYEGLKIQKTILENLTEEKIDEILRAGIKHDSGPCAECSSHCETLRICKTCAIEARIFQEDAFQWIINTRDSPILGAYYKAKQFSICGDCALDGRHAGHEIAHFRDFYEDRHISFQLFLNLITVLDLKHIVEEGRHEGSYLKYMYQSKLDASRIRKQRILHNFSSPILEHSFYVSLLFPKMNLENLHNEFKILHGEVMKMRYRLWMLMKQSQIDLLEDYRFSEEAKENPEQFELFEMEMRKVIANTLVEGEALEGEELEEIDRKVMDRIMKYCENPKQNVFQDLSKANQKHLENRKPFIRSVHIVIEKTCALNRLRTRKISRWPNGELSLLGVCNLARDAMDAEEERAVACEESLRWLITCEECLLESFLCQVIQKQTIDMVNGKRRVVKHKGIDKYFSLFKKLQKTFTFPDPLNSVLTYE